MTAMARTTSAAEAEASAQIDAATLTQANATIEFTPVAPPAAHCPLHDPELRRGRSSAVERRLPKLTGLLPRDFSYIASVVWLKSWLVRRALA